MRQSQRVLSVTRVFGLIRSTPVCLAQAGGVGGGARPGQSSSSSDRPPQPDMPASKSVPLNMYLTVDEHTSTELRDRLNKQRSVRASRGVTLETEGKLIIQLSRSPHVKERMEALERGEALWGELNEESEGIPLPTRTAMRVTLCSALRRCALVCKLSDVAELWTERFAVRASSLRPDDFNQQPTFAQGGGHDGAGGGESGDGTLGWRDARARPGTGLTEEDLEEDAKERAQERQRTRRGKQQSPMQQLRHDVLLDHPTVEYAFKKRGGPGPRYTG